MQKLKIWQQSFLFALGEGVYLFLVASLMKNADQLFGNKPSVFSMITFLLLLVFSAVVSGGLIFGRPIWLYWEGKKKEAIKFFGFTLGWLFVFLSGLLVFIGTSY